MKKIIIHEQRALVAKLIHKSSLAVRKHIPWLFSFLSKQKGLRKIYLRNKQFSLIKKSMPSALNMPAMFSNNNHEISLALKQATACWPSRKRLHG
jgi:hypothetical protein